MVTPLTANGRISSASTAFARFAIAAMMLGLAAGMAAAAPPKIRTDADNMVPRCVTPKRLMAFLKTRNSNLDPRFADIAASYKRHGEIWHVRWDYAFFQMAVETNFLTYRKGNGGWGDVNPKQNNFAGLGTTGGGVPGDSYPDVNTGVLAQIQHLVVYSGERIDEPVGARTKLKQDDILATMASKKGRATFADLARRWAADRNYGASIEWVANSYRESFCHGPDPAEEAEPAPRRSVKRVAAVEKLPPAANLGGPTEADTRPAAKQAPVRTIWSAADGPTEPAATVATPEPVQDEAPAKVHAAPIADPQARRRDGGCRRPGRLRADHPDRRGDAAGNRNTTRCGSRERAGDNSGRWRPACYRCPACFRVRRCHEHRATGTERRAESGDRRRPLPHRHRQLRRQENPSGPLQAPLPRCALRF